MLNILRQSFAIGCGDVYGLDLAPVRQFEEKHHLNTFILVVIRESILLDKMTPVLYQIIMNFTLDVSIHDVKRLTDVK